MKANVQFMPILRLIHPEPLPPRGKDPIAAPALPDMSSW